MAATSDLVANVIFVIEATAINGAYMHEMRNNYILPTLEHFSSQGLAEEYYSVPVANSRFVYGIVVYRTAQCMPALPCYTHGPFSSAKKVLSTIDQLR